MSRDLFIFIAFCVFMFLVGMRLRDRFKQKKKDVNATILKNQRSKMSKQAMDPDLRRHEESRERRIRRFTIVEMVIIFGLIIYMIPALVRDVMLAGEIEITNLFLRLVIFFFALYVFTLSYFKVFGKKKEE